MHDIEICAVVPAQNWYYTPRYLYVAITTVVTAILPGIVGPCTASKPETLF